MFFLGVRGFLFGNFRLGNLEFPKIRHCERSEAISFKIPSKIPSLRGSSAKDELIKRVQAGEITLSDGVMRDGKIITGSNAGASKISA